MNIILEFAIDLTFPLIVIGGTAFFLFKAVQNEKLIRPLRSQKVLFGFLILLTLFGFFTQQDFTESCGCLRHSRGVFSLDYIIFSAISLILLLIGLLIKNKTIRISLLSIELAYWIFKLFVLKSGYIGGLGIMVFKYYDFFGLLGRLLLLNSLFGNKLKEHLLTLVAGLLIIIKMLVMPCNENSTYKYYINSYYTNLIFQDLNGSWSGSMVYPKDSTIVETIENPDTALYGSIPEINKYRDTTFFFNYKNVDIFFNDSSLTIGKTAPELNGIYYLTYSHPAGFLVYLPSEYKDDVKREYHYNQYHIKVILGNVSDSTLSFTINHRTELKLKKSR